MSDWPEIYIFFPFFYFISYLQSIILTSLLNSMFILKIIKILFTPFLLNKFNLILIIKAKNIKNKY